MLTNFFHGSSTQSVRTYFCAYCLLAILGLVIRPALAQDAQPPVAEASGPLEARPLEAGHLEAGHLEAGHLEAGHLEGESRGLIDFNRDVRPIFESHCIDCHGPKEAKEGFRVDEKDTLLSYVEPGDIEASTIWADYLVTADEKTKMPPASHNKPLSGAQLATIKLWIEEGAKWSDLAPTEPVAPPPVKSQFQRVTTFLGLFHPAAVHFPVALLLISTFFLLCSFVYRDAFENAAFHCLWIGAISACASCVLGWFFAESQGYSSTPTFDFNNGLERHRWTAITLSVLSIIIVPIAMKSRRDPDNRKRRITWLVGASLLALLVSMAGHQGGELVYGEALYTPAFNAIFETPPTN